MHRMTGAAAARRDSVPAPETPPAARYAVTSAQLHDGLVADLIAGKACWIRTDGLDVTVPRAHGEFLRAIAPFGVRESASAPRPHTAVFDWSATQSTTIAALSEFAIVVPWLGGSGATIICVEPSVVDVATALEQAAFEHAVGFRWVEASSRGRSPLTHLGGAPFGPSTRGRAAGTRVDLLTPPLLLDLTAGESRRSNREQFGAAVRMFERAGADLGLPSDVSSAAAALLFEVMSNASKHSSAARVAVTLGVTGTSQRRLEFAVADDGIGIAATVGRRLGAIELNRVPERALLTGLFTGGDADGRRPGGRGTSYAARALLDSAPAVLYIRSGGALLRLDRSGPIPGVVARASHGFGTVVTCAIPLPPPRS